jgi:hypothetical protein
MLQLVMNAVKCQLKYVFLPFDQYKYREFVEKKNNRLFPTCILDIQWKTVETSINLIE